MFEIADVNFNFMIIRPSDRHRCYALRKANSRKRLLLRAHKTDVSIVNATLPNSSKLWLQEGDDKAWELSRKQEEIVSNSNMIMY